MENHTLREKELEFLQEKKQEFLRFLAMLLWDVDEEKKAKIKKEQEFLREKVVRVVIKLMEEKKLNVDHSDLQESLLQTLKIMFSSKRT